MTWPYEDDDLYCFDCDCSPCRCDPEPRDEDDPADYYALWDIAPPPSLTQSDNTLSSSQTFDCPLREKEPVG